MDKIEKPKYIGIISSGKEVTMRALIENALKQKPRNLIIENPVELNLRPEYEYKTTCEKISKNKKRFIRKKCERRILVVDEAYILIRDMLGAK